MKDGRFAGLGEGREEAVIGERAGEGDRARDWSAAIGERQIQRGEEDEAWEKEENTK